MRQPPPPRRARPLHLAVALIGLTASLGLASAVGCGPFDKTMFWICLNAETGKLDDNTYDENNYANGEPDPCHCYDPCGPAKTCPIVVDAGPPAPVCDAGDGGP
ncbi:MAG: hypothetical protein QM820_63670 [Minicystis sp.]